MCRNDEMVSLGFCDDQVPPGTHICQIYSSEEERSDSLLSFLMTGLLSGERAACFSRKADEAGLRDSLADRGLAYDDYEKRLAISMNEARDVYFEDGVFDPDRILAGMADYYRETSRLGFEEARVIGEMVPEIGQAEGGGRLVEYESRVTMLLEEYPLTAVCQYNAHQFSGAIIMDVLKVHPRMVINRKVVHNPFYIPPEVALGGG